MKDNSAKVLERSWWFVNCFQKLLSSWWRTTFSTYRVYFINLWIAFKNYYLRDEGQRASNGWKRCRICELLSKIIIFVMKDSDFAKFQLNAEVVNCFQKLLSSWWRTAVDLLDLQLSGLWIAFKNYYLRDEGQRYPIFYLYLRSCELLSKIIIFVMKDSLRSLSSILQVVVNCFQKLLSSWWRTAFKLTDNADSLLWIAFKNYYLRDEGQLFSTESLLSRSCELLSKIIIFVMKDSFAIYNSSKSWVVNCFQKLLSSWWRTASWRIIKVPAKLWIAFKNYYLRDEGQLC